MKNRKKKNKQKKSFLHKTIKFFINFFICLYVLIISPILIFISLPNLDIKDEKTKKKVQGFFVSFREFVFVFILFLLFLFNIVENVFLTQPSILILFCLVSILIFFILSFKYFKRMFKSVKPIFLKSSISYKSIKNILQKIVNTLKIRRKITVEKSIKPYLNKKTLEKVNQGLGYFKEYWSVFLVCFNFILFIFFVVLSFSTMYYVMNIMFNVDGSLTLYKYIDFIIYSINITGLDLGLEVSNIFVFKLINIIQYFISIISLIIFLPLAFGLKGINNPKLEKKELMGAVAAFIKIGSKEILDPYSKKKNNKKTKTGNK